LNVLIIRFSALGDVILTIPVVNALIENNSDLNIWILSNIKNKTLFEFNERVHFVGADLKGEHNKIYKLNSFVNKIHEANKFDVIYDLHDVIRSKVLRLNFMLKGVKTKKYFKGRKEKNKLIAKKIDFKKLKHTSTRYLETFEKDFGKLSIKSFVHPLLVAENNSINLKNTIGIAPFAAHSSKEWPIAKFIPIIESLPTYNFIFFAYGKREIDIINKIFCGFKNISIADNNLNFSEQIKLIDSLSAMIAMDSANMHLSSITHTKVVSIWGPTHHFTGFGPLNNEDYIVEIPKEDFSCRPCSIYGKINAKTKLCAQESMSKIKPEMVMKILNKIVS
jgi:ADP-heptose:LPS heptosyltransferase